MSFPSMEDMVATSPVTVDDHTVDNSAPLIQGPHPQQSMTTTQYVFPDRTDIRYEYESQHSRTLWAWSGDIPFCLWHDEGALKNYCADYSQQSPGTDRIPFDLGIAHKHTDTSKVCFSVSTNQFWEIYRLSCAIPDNNLPQLVPTTGFILNASPTLPALPLYQPISQREHSENLGAVNGLAYPDDNEISNHSGSPLAIAEQERDIRPLPRTSTRRRGTAIRDHTFSTLATAAKRKVPGCMKTGNTTHKRVKVSPPSPVASTSSTLSSLTDLSPSLPVSSSSNSPSPPRADQPSGDEDLCCIYPDCCELFSSADRVIDHHKAVHTECYSGKYRCAFESCKQTFKNKADFERHAQRLIHQPAKEFLCAGCGFAFTRSDSWKRHQKKRSG